MSESGPPSIRHRALQSMNWSLLGQLAQQSIRLGVTIALARLLAPADFGLVAMVGTLTSFATVFTEAGVSSALIQRKELSRSHVAAAGWLVGVLGIGFAAITVAASPLIARFYHHHALRGLAIGFAADFIVSAPGLVPAALLSRELKFRRLVSAEVIGTAVGGAAALVQATLRPGPWPMVTFLIVTDVVTSVLLVASAGYPVVLKPEWWALRDLWSFSGGLLGYTIFNYWSRNADNVLVGRSLGSVALGVYSRAYVILLFPVQQVAQVINRVMFPAMSAVQDDHPRVCRAYLMTVAVVGFVVFPVAAVLSAASHELVIGLLGQSWSGAVPIVRVFAAVAAIQSIGTTTGWLYQVTGHTTRMFHVTIGLTVLVLIAFIVGVQFGLMGVVYGYLVWNCISLPANLVEGGRGVGLNIREVGGALAVPFAMGAVLYGVLVTVRLGLVGLPPLLGLAVLVAAGAVCYALEVRLVRPLAWTQLRHAIGESRGVPPPSLTESGLIA